MTETIAIKDWIFTTLSPKELVELAYEFGVKYPTEALRGAMDGQATKHRRVTSDDIVHAVAHHYSVQAKHIYGPGRSKRFSEARKAAAELMRHGMNMTLDHIGDVLGGRDHSTILYMLENVNLESEAFKNTLNELRNRGFQYDRS